MRRYYQVLSVDDSKNLYNVLIYKIFFSYIKDQTIYQLGIIKKQRRATTKACKKYQHLSEEEKQKKQQHGRKRYKNLS